MSDTMKVQPFEVLLGNVLAELETCDAIFGIPRKQFYVPQAHSPYALEDFYGQYLATPIGPAAGPHTQLSQNIISAWLAGGRYIELKTVQIMDELEIPRPCIDMEDEGYNVEWSQELKLEQSAREYINAWVVIHILHRLLGYDKIGPLGTIFNMSVGYNLEGIQSAPMQHFMDRMVDASAEIGEIRQILATRFPQFADIEIPTRLTNSVTLSTMHGCPPDEIERIAAYVLQERHLHTTVKLNPTLLGKDMVLGILHDDLGFDYIDIPDSVFEHDLCYDGSLELIRALQSIAAEEGLTFAVKLSNTLAMTNGKGALPGGEMYMSGRALYPLTMNLFAKLSAEFGGKLNVSFSAGADAGNITSILAAGAWPVTAASDLLKPGGYARMGQWLENLECDMRAAGAGSLAELAADRVNNVAKAAAESRVSPRYKKSYFPFGLPKVSSGLGLFDCVVAPCEEQCAVNQDVPEYAWLIAQGEYDRALEVILARNPLPGVTGYVCTHLCQTRCTRNNYDEPVAIRALKRAAAERGQVRLPAGGATGRKVAIVGSGPAGLSAAAFLALQGVQATIFEAKDRAGGMLGVAPAFRLPPEVVQADIERITGMGVDIKLSHPITQPPASLLAEGYDAVFVACGFPQDARLDIPGVEGEGVYAALDVLGRTAAGHPPALGQRVLVIGGGNTAMDAARTARRLTGQPVTVVYRRTEAQMPATDEEKHDLFEEGNQLIELAAPVRVVRENGKLVALECVRNRLGEPGRDGRREPVTIPGSEFQIPADAIIVAVGQRADVSFLDGSDITVARNGAVVVDPATGQAGNDPVFAGGDATRGPAIIIQAAADGRRAAEAICARFGIQFDQFPARSATLSAQDISQVQLARTRKVAQRQPDVRPIELRNGFDLVEQTFDDAAARAEAARCLQCSTICDKCVEVCPNRANRSYQITPVSWQVPQLACRGNELAEVSSELFTVSQSRQIVHIDDYCNECGNCATFCVHQGRPYHDKPRLFLELADFRAESDNAFHLTGQSIWRREGGHESCLTRDDSTFIYEDERARVTLSSSFELRDLTLKEAFEGTLSLRPAAEMAVILSGLTGRQGC